MGHFWWAGEFNGGEGPGGLLGTQVTVRVHMINGGEGGGCPKGKVKTLKEHNMFYNVTEKCSLPFIFFSVAPSLHGPPCVSKEGNSENNSFA